MPAPERHQPNTATRINVATGFADVLAVVLSGAGVEYAVEKKDALLVHVAAFHADMQRISVESTVSDYQRERAGLTEGQLLAIGLLLDETFVGCPEPSA